MKAKSFIMVMSLLLRMNLSGIAQVDNLNPDFGTGGIQNQSVYNFATIEIPEGMAIQSDGKIVLAGLSYYNIPNYGQQSRSWLIRFNADGSLDNTFSGDGIDTTRILPGPGAFYEMALQADDSILTYGFFYESESFNGLQVLFNRFTSNGLPDMTFGNKEILVGEHGYRDMKIDGDRRIITCGQIAGFDHEEFKYKWDWLISRYTPDGIIDSTFNATGHYIYEFEHGNYSLNDLLIDVTGRLIAGGNVIGDDIMESQLPGIIRCNNDGTIDNSFANNGIYVYPEATTYSIFSVALQNDGRIIALGNTGNGYGYGPYVLVIRLNEDGTLDNTFGTGGVVKYEEVTTGISGEKVALQSDGKIVVACKANLYNESNEYGQAFVIIRYNTDGTLDDTFGSGGLIVTHHGLNSQCELSDMVLIPDKNILVAGMVNGRITLINYLPVKSSSVTINQNQIEHMAIAYPNPTDEYIRLTNLHSGTTELRWKIIDITGKTVRFGTLRNGNDCIYTGNLSPAVYILQATDSYQQGVINLKIVKK
jgi:uncharacterized delta-60 repeat protein